jgi:hypothetical protein
LAVAFIVAAMIVHERSIERESYRGVFWTTLLFLCACAAKEIAIVFPALLLLWERTRMVPVAWTATFNRVAPYAIASVAAMTAMLLLSPRYRELLAFSLSLRSPLDAMLHNIVALPINVSLWFSPWALSVEHEVSFSNSALLLGAGLLAAAVTVAITQCTRRPMITLALLWPLIAMLPTHSVVAKSDPVTEGSLYLAWIGPGIAFGRWLALRTRAKGSICAKSIAVAASILAITLCQWRVSVWRDSVSLWQEATLRAPTSTRAWGNLGVARLAHGQYDTARMALQTAVELDPQNMQARLNLDIVAALAASARSTHER